MHDYKAIDSFIRAVLRQRGVHYYEMDDAAQDTWIALLARNALNRARDMKPYVARITTNVWKDSARKNGRYQDTGKKPGTRGRNKIRKDEVSSIDDTEYVTLTTDKPSIEDQLIHRADLRLAVEDALQRLNKRQFRIVTLKMEGHLNREIVSIEGCCESYVEKTLRTYREGAPLVRNSR